MSEAVVKIIKWAFSKYPSMMRVQSFHLPQNIGSGRVMTKAGMQTEGTLRSYVFWKGIPADAVMHSIVRGEHLK